MWRALLILALPASLLASSARNQADAAQPLADSEAAYTKTIEKRAQDVVSALNLADEAKAANVRDALTSQYRKLRDWHDAYDARLKDLNKKLVHASDVEAERIRGEIAQIKATLRPAHDEFLARLAKDLTPDQVEIVKDKLTYNVVRVTYDAYGQMLPSLTEPQKARILAMLKEAREEAMDGGSAEEKHAIFGRYKGRINNYLSAEGYDLKQASRELAEKLKAREAAGKSPNPQPK